MKNLKSKIKKSAKKVLASFLLMTTIVWSFGASLMLSMPVANAASTIVVSTDGLPTDMPGSPISTNSLDMPVLKISVTASQASQTLNAVTVNFSGTNFDTTDLATLAVDGDSGVAIYGDTSDDGNYSPGTDTVITLASAPEWSSGAVTLTPVASSVSLTNGSTDIFFVVIKTSGTIENNNQIIATIPASGVVTLDSNGPTADFSANYMIADTAAASISSVSGSDGSATLTVMFSKPVKKFGADFSDIAFVSGTDPFIFTDHGGGSKAVTAVTHTAGQDFATVTLSGNLGADDLADGGNGISALAAASEKISDMGGIAVGTDTVAIANPLNIATDSIPSTTVGTTYEAGTPLVTFAASGGASSYTWAPAGTPDTDLLTLLALSLDTSTGKLTGTVADVPGSYSVNIKVTDGASANWTKFFNINVAPSGGGGIPGITSVVPGGGAQSAVNMPVVITGINTSFTTSSTVQFLLNGAVDSDLTVASVASTGVTNLSFNVTIDGAATAGSRDVKVTTGTQQVTMPNGFGVYASGGSGLNLMFPADAGTGVQMPPSFSFDPSTDATINSYRITINTTSNFAGTTLWDYTFPKPAEGNTNNSHCDTYGCNTGYGEGRFMILTQPTPLAPNTTYYWRVRTYTESAGIAISSATAVESTAVRSFTTTTSMSDVEPPNIMHRQIFQATAETDLSVIARVMDNLATVATTPALTAKIYFCSGAADNTCTPTYIDDADHNGTLLGAGYYKFTIPSATIDVAGKETRYYLEASDGTNTSTLEQLDGTTPFRITSVAAGTSAKITGNVKDMATPTPNNLADVYVFAEGTGFLSAQTGADGNFALPATDILFPGNYDLIAFKSGYNSPMIDGVPAGTTGMQFTLGQGFEGGFGGDTVKPRVMFTGPMDGMSGIPGNDTNFKIFIVFDKEMSQSKFAEIGNMQVKKITDFSTTIPATSDIAGSWIYYNTNPGLSDVPPENNMAVFSPGEVFGDNQTIIVSVTSNITDTAGNSVQGNMPNGSYSFMFTTGSSAIFTGGTLDGGTFGQGGFMPPHVTGTMPSPGSMSVPTNNRLTINFSDPMADDAGGYTLASYVQLFTVSSGVETNVTSSAINTVVLDGSKLNAAVNLKDTYNSGLFAANTSYRLKVLGGAKAANGMMIAPPGSESMMMFMSDFKTGATSDTDAPTVIGSYPDNNATDVPVNIGAINIAFNKDMNSSTVSTSTFYLSIGATTINGTVEYRGIERQAFFIPKSALNPNTTYTINITTSATGLNEQAIETAVARTFTTGSADSIAPEIVFMNADDYGIALSFSEPMNAAKATDTLNWSTSVLNPAVYDVIKSGSAGFNPSSAGTTVDFTGATFKYDAVSTTVMVEGLNLVSAIGQELYFSMDVAGDQITKDLSGNQITSNGNSARSPIQNSATTMGALGPMAMGASAFGMGGGFMPDNFSGDTFGFAPPVDVMPFNMMAGKTTIYGIRIPISTQIPASGAIVLTFPIGFDVSGAKQDVNSPMRTDLNGPGTGTPTFKCETAAGGTSCGGSANSNDTGAAQGGLADDGVVVNTSARSVTIYLSAATNVEGYDFLTIDIDGIVNSTVPKGFETSGYTVDVKTKNGATVLESLTSMPFFIQEAGNYTLSGTITATNTTDGTMKVYLCSPMTGPTETTSGTFSDGSATYSFTGLSAGDYMLFTNQTITLTGGEFEGKSMPERIVISEAADIANGGNNDDVIPYNFSLSNNASGTEVIVSIDGPNGELLDIFAGSPTGFKVKQVTLDGSSGSQNFTINLGDGNWFVGVGPQMPKGPMSGPPPAPNYLPPRSIEVGISGATVTENSGANDGTIVFVLTSSDKTIRGLAQDGAGKVIANAEVYAYSPNGGFGTHAQADSAGAFTLNVTTGSYIVGAFIPGMPSSREIPVTVTSDGTTYLVIDGAAAITPAAAATSFILKLDKPDYTISGKVTDGTNVVQGASVYAYRTDGPGHANANTNSSGQYTLYVSAGTWNVGSFLPQYGQLAEVEVTVSSTTGNITNQNFSPTGTGTFHSVSGRVYQDNNGNSGYDAGEEVQGAFVKISGNSTANETKTGADGTYSFKVPAGNGYIIRAFIPAVGETAPLAAFDVAADVTDKDISVGVSRTITFTFSESVTEAFIDLFGSTGIGNHTKINNSTTGTLTLPDGDYKVRVDVPGTAIGLTDIAATDGDTTYSNTTGIITVADGNEGLTITLPTLRTITGTVTDGTNNIANAWVEIIDPTNGIHFGTMTDSTASGTNFSFKAADGTYFINAMKPGYFRESSQIVIGAETTAQTLTLSTAEKTISGQVLIGAAGATNAFVRAEKQGGGFAGTQTDTSGNYILYVTSGVWKVFAVAERYAEAEYTSNPIDMTTASTTTNKDITLSTVVNLNAPKSKPITPSSGGTLEDTTAGIKLTIPANSLGSSTSAGNIQSKDTNNIRETNSSKPLNKYDSTNGSYAQSAKEITATDSSGNPITNLSSDVTVEMTYTKAELANTASAADSSINTKDEADDLKMAYWDETSSNWVTKPSTVAYKDASGNIITDATTIDTAAEFNATVATVVISANTDHFSLYAPVVSTNPSAPATPAGLAGTAASTTQINLSWTEVTGATSYDIYRSSSVSGTYARLGSEPTVSSGSTITYSDTGLTANTTYYYKITSINTSGESAASSAVSVATEAETVSSGGSAASSIPSSTTGQAAITSSSGGTVSKTNSDGSSAKVVFLSDTLSENATVTVAPKTKASITASRPIPVGKNVVGSYVYNFTAVSGTTSVSSFEKAVTITLTYTDAQVSGLNEGALKIYYWNETSSKWVALEDSSANSVNNTVSATTTHFTYFTIMGDSESGGEIPAGSETSTANINDGDLIRATGDYKIYIIKGNYKRHILDGRIFDFYGHLNWDAVKEVSSAQRDFYQNASLVRLAGGVRVYEVNGDKTKHWLDMTAENFYATGRTEGIIYSINKNEMDLYISGVNVMYAGQ